MKNLWIITLFLLLTSIVTISSAQAFSTSGLVAWYDMENSNTTLMIDSTGNHDMIASGGTTFFTSGKIGNGTQWSGSVTYNTTNFAFSNTSDWSYNVWVKNITATNTELYFWIKNSTADNGIEAQILTTGNNMRNGTLGGTYALNGTPYVANTNFMMITYTYDHATNMLRYYVNGTLNKNITFRKLSQNSNTVIFGEMQNSITDLTSLWNKTLTQSDITTLFNNGSGLTYNLLPSIPDSFNYTIKPFSDNFYRSVDTQIIGDTTLCTTNESVSVTDSLGTYFGGSSTTCISTTCTDTNGNPISCKYDDTAGIINTYPSNTGFQYATMIYEINASQSGYYNVICNRSFVGIIASALYNLTFDSCENSTTCGLIGNITFQTDIMNTGNGRQLILNSTGYNTFNMPSMSNPSYNNYEAVFQYRPWTNAETVFSIDDAYGQNILNVLVTTDGTMQTCFYNIAGKTGIEAKTLMYCISNVLTNKDLDINIVYDNPSSSYYLKTTNTYDNVVYTSNIFSTLTNGFPDRFSFNIVTAESYTYIDNFVIYGHATALTLISATIPQHVTCNYPLNTCTNTRIYFSTVQTDLSHYKDFPVCAITDSQAVQDISAGFALTQEPPSTPTLKNAKLTPAEWHMILAVIFMFSSSLLAGVLIGLPTKNAMAGLIAFLITLIVGVVLFGILGWISIIFAILIGIIDAIAIVFAFKMLFFSTAG